MKLKVFANSDWGEDDLNICVEIDVDFLPRKGEILYLSEEHQSQLEEKIKSKPNMYFAYSRWFYGFSIDKIKAGEEITIEMFEDFGLDDAIYVCKVAFIWSDEEMKYVNYVVLNDSEEY